MNLLVRNETRIYHDNLIGWKPIKEDYKPGVFYGGLTDEEGDCLFRYCQTPGPHVDIGCHQGGSAHTAALAKNGNGMVYTVDVNSTYCKDVVKFFDRAMPDWRDRITIVNASSRDWDPPERPTTVLIDGDHTRKGCLADWEKYSALKPDYILFHDNDHGEIRNIIDAAAALPEWELVDEAKKVSVLRRVKDAAG